MTRLLAIALLAACVESSTVSCPSGRVCPASDTCRVVADVEMCATDDQLAACEGQADLAGCDPSDERKYCLDGVCVSPCGNGRVEPGETCDDGNASAGDGCSPRCQTEVCGNGIIDPAGGEQCDEGTFGLSGDGCSSACTVEPSGWSELTAQSLSPRAGVGLVYMDTLASVLAFGGSGPEGFLGDTWIRSEAGWTRLDPPQSPPGRENHGIAFIGSTTRVIIFGGFGANGALGDTWEWDGITWTERTPAVSPPPRFGAQLAYDALRQRIVLHGGRTVAGPLSDTWEWDPAMGTWTQRTPALHPAGHLDVQLAYDGLNNRVVYCGVGGAAAQTWTWNGTSWSDLGQPCPASSSETNRIAYDARRFRVVALVGGTQEVYALEPGGWTLLTSTSVDVPRVRPGFVGDRNGVFQVGGKDASGQFLGDEWSLQAMDTQWQQGLARAAAPSQRHGAVAIRDPDRGRALVFGGERNGASTDYTWAWGPRRWTQHTGPQPPVRRAPAMALDAARGQVVLFGGGVPGPASDTWTYDVLTESWTSRTSTPTPPAREGGAMVYDPVRERVILFGGRGSSGLLDDTWAWNGDGWTKLTLATSPAKRSHHVMAYDPLRDRIVLFGGMTGTSTLASDTWEWDGATWTQITPSLAPAPRAWATLTYDPLRRRLVLVGGTDAPTRYATFGDWWEWDGVTWTMRGEDPRIARSGHAAFFDPIRGGIAVFGGTESALPGAQATTEMWLLRHGVDTGEQCGAVASQDADGDGLTGCEDPDCWGRCTPRCPPGTSCPADAPRCGDGSCERAIEDYLLCPQDCT